MNSKSSWLSALRIMLIFADSGYFRSRRDNGSRAIMLPGGKGD